MCDVEEERSMMHFREQNEKKDIETGESETKSEEQKFNVITKTKEKDIETGESETKSEE